MAHIIGTNGNDSLVGTSGVDTIEGLGGNDTLVGNAGNDSLIGGLGDDRYVVGSGDVLSDSGGVDTVESNVSWTLVAGFENLTFTGTSTTSGSGNSLNNVITGSGGNNWLRGLEGNDTINAGAGNDTINMSNASGASYGSDVINGGDGVDTLDYGTAARTAVLVDLVAGTASGGGTGGAGSVVLTSIENVNGSGFDDRISGNAVANFLYGFNGNDTLDGGAGNDRLEGAAGNDQYVFSVAPDSSNADTITGFTTDADKIVLDAAVHSNIGVAGNFAAGDGRFAAGAGFTSGQDAGDRVIYNTSTGQLFYDSDGSGAGQARLVATLQGAPALAATDILVTGGSSTSGTAGNDSLTGSAGDDTINGLAGNDTIRGLAGDDLLLGSAGDDSLDGGDGNDELDSGDGRDSLFGGAGNDVLNPSFLGAGGDTLDGGLGDDTYYAWTSDIITDPGGIDTVVTAGQSYTLGAGLEHLTFVNWWEDNGFHGLEGYGNELDNQLIGGTGADGILLDGREGNDTLIGTFYPDLFLASVGPGAANADVISGWDNSDRIRLNPDVMPALGQPGTLGANDARFSSGAGFTSGQDSSDRVIYNTTTGDLYYDADGSGSAASLLIARLDGAPSLSPTNIEVGSGSGGDTIVGTAGDDSINGTISGDAIDGLAGNDTINGAGGTDTLIGGAGNDSIAGGDAPFEEDRTGGDQLIGGDGDDTLDGWGNGWRWFADFADTLDGGLGNDVYHVDHPDDVLMDAGGVDTVFAENVGTFTLGAGLENLSLFETEGGGGAFGNELDNVLSVGRFGGAFGRGGNDTLFGGQESGLHGEAGDDWLEAEMAWMGGGEGNDTLVGMGNEMTGGAGADHFGTREGDGVVTDFTHAEDTIRLDGNFYAHVGSSGRFSVGDERFYAAAGATEAHDATDRVIYNTTTGQVFYDADGTGSGPAQGLVFLEGAPDLAATDIEVVNGTSSGALINGTAGDDSLIGTADNDTINGLGGNDTLLGLEGEDVLAGGDGNDSLDGGAGVDLLDGGAGNDTYLVTEGDQLVDSGGIDEVVSGERFWTLGSGFENLTITGHGSDGEGNELANVMRATTFGRLRGWDGNDTLHAASVDNELTGDGGDDLVLGGDGGDRIFGGAGNDALFGNGGDDRFTQGIEYGNDSIDGGAGIDWLELDEHSFTGVSLDLSSGLASGGGTGGAGSMRISGIENVVGTRQADRLIGNDAANFLLGELGNDTLNGGGGNDTLSSGGESTFAFSHHGAANADLVSGFSSGTDTMALDASAFSAIGASGDFTAGDVRFFAGAGVNAGQDASDRVVYNTATGELWYDADGNGAGGAQLIATLSGRPAVAATDIQVTGAAPSSGQTINGTAGNDTLAGGAGNDTINGQAGADLLQGMGGNDSVAGSTGWDTLQGGDGNDTLNGQGWSDTLTGGAGNDSFVWTEAGSNTRDTVTDFASGTDELLFENGTLTAMGAAGSWGAGDGRFWAAAGATAGHDADDRLVYNTSTGNLYYDADGSGAGAAQIIATFQGNPAIAASDITVI